MPPALYALPVEGKGLSCGHPPGMRARSQSTEGGVSGIIMQFVIVHLIHLYEDALLYGFSQGEAHTVRESDIIFNNCDQETIDGKN